jgi:hypothetical protein
MIVLFLDGVCLHFSQNFSQFFHFVLMTTYNIMFCTDTHYYC